MRYFDFIIIGAGIAGLITSYLFKDYKTLLIDKNGILEGASKAAGAFLFPKISKQSSYTDFINSSIIEAFKFYDKLGINTNKKGVLLLPRDERDIKKFKEYEKYIKLPFEKRGEGFFFKDGGFIEVDEVREKIRVPFLKEEVVEIKREGEYWRVNDILTKNIILATGYESIVNIPYIKIRAIWGERIEISGKWEGDLSIYYHKNCSVAEINNRLRIGATHKRDCLDCRENEEEALELINRAKKIINIKEYKIEDIKGGFRAGSIDFFPVVGRVIDVKETFKLNPKVVKGVIPKEVKYIDGLYIINGMGGRGFSNSIMCAKMLKVSIEKGVSLGKIDNTRLFIKWARKEGEKFLRRIDVKS